jgi:hypothetical protein
MDAVGGVFKLDPAVGSDAAISLVPFKLPDGWPETGSMAGGVSHGLV